MMIKSFLGGFDKNFCYVIWCEKTMLGAIIDPSVEPSEIFEFIEEKSIKLDKILITHTHHDHIKYLDDFLARYPLVNIYGHEFSLKVFEKNRYKGLSHLENINIGEAMMSALLTPGHYADSVCYWNINEEVLFTGDTMFVGRTGRVKSESSNINDLFKSIYNIILNLPDRTVIYPGHHYGHVKSITLKDNLVLSNFFQCADFDQFASVMEKFENSKRKN